MEEKKNPKADLTRKAGFFFSVGLLVTMSVVLTAFEWKQHEMKITDLVHRSTDVFEENEVLATEILPPVPPVIKAPIIMEVPDDVITEEVLPAIDIEMTELMALEPVAVTIVDEPEIVTDDPFPMPQSPAEFNGGINAFYKYVAQKIKYPVQAQRIEIQGKVFVEFVVNRDGSITDVKVVKGIGAGCDEEAARVVQSSPAWRPAKQRGKPVRQRMVLPITFTLTRH